MGNQRLQIPTQGIDINSDVTTWALPDGAIARLGKGSGSAVAFSPTIGILAVGTKVGLWLHNCSTQSPVALWETKRGMISAVAFSSDGRLLATANWDGTVKVWDVPQAMCVAQLGISQASKKYGGRFSQLAFSSDGQRLAAARITIQHGKRRSTICVWELQTGRLFAQLIAEMDRKRITGDTGLPLPGPALVPIAFSPDGSLLASGSFDHTVSVWAMERGEKVSHFTGHIGWVNGVCFSPCGDYLASSDYEGAIRVWSLAKGVQERAYTENATNRILPSYLPDGELIAAQIHENRVEVWAMESGKKRGSFEHKERINGIRFSHNGTPLVVTSPSQIRVWNGESPSTDLIISGRTHMVYAVAFAPDGKTLASGSSREIILWDVEHKRPRATFLEGNLTAIHSVGFSPCGNILVGCAYDILKVWNVDNGKQIAELTARQELMRVAAFSPKDQILAIGHTAGDLYIWDDWGKPKGLTGHTETIKSIAFSPDGRLLVSGADDHTARLWDVERGMEIGTLSTAQLPDADKYRGDACDIQRAVESAHSSSKANSLPKKRIEAIAFSPCGTLIAAGLHGEIRLWDATTYEICMVILPPKSCQKPYALTFSPCGRYLASGAWWQGTEKVPIRLWEVASGEKITTFWGHPTDVHSLAFSPDGSLLASGSFDGTILLWDMKPYL